jgi:hypothetical protein
MRRRDAPDFTVDCATTQHQEQTAMIRHSTLTALIPAFALLSWSAASGALAAADDTPPPASAPGSEGPGRHHDPAWAACKKQADDQKLQHGDARREFMHGCLKSAHGSTPAAP